MAERINAVKTSFFGKGAIRLLGPELQKMGIRRALLVTDRFLYDSGAAARSVRLLSDAGVEYAVYYNVHPTPPLQVVERLHCRSPYPAGAAAGGSGRRQRHSIPLRQPVIVVACGGTVEQYEGENKSSKPGLPIVACEHHRRYRQRVHLLLHRHRPCPPQQNGHGGPQLHGQHCGERHRLHVLHAAQAHRSHRMDALTHAIEAALSKNANPLTDKDAYWPCRQIVQKPAPGVANGQDEAARTMMAYAENVAGMAFSNAGLGMVHAMAHALGGHYNLPHGVCNAVLLPYVLAFNSRSPVCRERFMTIAAAMGLQGTFTPDTAAPAVILVCPSAQCRVGIPRKPCAAEHGGPCRFCRAGRACAARHLHVHQPDHPHQRRGGGGIYRCFPRINFETSSIFSIPQTKPPLSLCMGMRRLCAVKRVDGIVFKEGFVIIK